MVKNKGGSGGSSKEEGNHVLQGSSWQEIKEVLGDSSKEEGNHVLQGSSWQEIKEVLGGILRKKGIMGYRGVHGKK